MQQLAQAHAAECWIGCRIGLFLETGVPIDEALGQFLVRQGHTLAVAESCTGGALGARFGFPGRSERLFSWRGSVLLQCGQGAAFGRRWALISELGAVSEEVAVAMAQGATRKVWGGFWGVHHGHRGSRWRQRLEARWHCLHGL